MLVKKGGVNIETKELKITASDVYDDGFLRVEHKNFYATWKGEMLRLTRAEFLIVSRLVRTRERFVSPEELWEVIWGTRKKYNAMSIRVYMYRLRNLFEPLGMEIDNLPSTDLSLMQNLNKGIFKCQKTSRNKPSKPLF